MRILHVGKYFAPFAGGIENFMRDLMASQCLQGHEVAAIVHAHTPWQRTTDEHVNHCRVWRVRTFGSVLYSPISPTFGWHFARAIDRFNPDILHLHMPNPSAFWALVIPKAKSRPWIVHWHSDVVASPVHKRLHTAYRFYHPLEQALLRRSARVIVTSPPYLEASKPLQPWRDRCRIIPLGLPDTNPPAIAPECYHHAEQYWPAGQLRVITIGRLSHYKGHHVLIQAIARTPNAHLVLVGDGEQASALRQAIEHAQITDRVTMTGYLPDDQLDCLLHTADLFCLPSLERSEAFGLVLLEAIRHGKSVIASDIPGSGVNWVVRTTNAGMLVTPNAPADLASALARHIHDPSLRTRHAIAARQAAPNFHINRIAERITSIYHEALNA